MGRFGGGRGGGRGRSGSGGKYGPTSGAGRFAAKPVLGFKGFTNHKPGNGPRPPSVLPKGTSSSDPRITKSNVVHSH